MPHPPTEPAKVIGTDGRFDFIPLAAGTYSEKIPKRAGTSAGRHWEFEVVCSRRLSAASTPPASCMSGSTKSAGNSLPALRAAAKRSCTLFHRSGRPCRRAGNWQFSSVFSQEQNFTRRSLAVMKEL
jgi:hypothetical protein